MTSTLLERLRQAHPEPPLRLDPAAIIEELRARSAAEAAAWFAEHPVESDHDDEMASRAEESFSKRRKRKPSIAAAARLAAKEGVEVKIAPDGTVTVTPTKPLDITPTTDTDTENEWDRLQ
jgi:hypothetical protein